MPSPTALFRVTIPAGGGDYRVVYFGHATGGDYTDDDFDTDLAQEGAGKVSFRFDGWTGKDFAPTFTGLLSMFRGSAHFSALMLQSIARGAAIQLALSSAIGDALSAPTFSGTLNPAVGRRPKLDTQIYAGGSLGGSVGLVIASIYPNIAGAVLNDPGAGWTHFMPQSVIYSFIDQLLGSPYGTRFDGRLALAMSQGIWDEFDGAVWDVPDHPRPVSLIQESMGDPVLPNIGSDLLASALGAVQLGGVLEPISGLTTTLMPTHQTAITQYRVPASIGDYKVHGFVECDNVAATAAHAQIIDFVRSVWNGAPTATVPSGCAATSDGSCDFSALVTSCDP